MDNANFQADYQSWCRSGGADKDGKPIWRELRLTEKTTPKDFYDSMLRSGIAFPTEFKISGKKIEFARLAKSHPSITVKGNKILLERNTKQSNFGLKDALNVKGGIQAIKDAASGVDNPLFTITDMGQYFELISEPLFRLLYNQISEKYMRYIRKK